jgi:hypothetical protein
LVWIASNKRKEHLKKKREKKKKEKKKKKYKGRGKKKKKKKKSVFKETKRNIEIVGNLLFWGDGRVFQ